MPSFSGKENQSIWLYLDARAACDAYGAVPPGVNSLLERLREGFNQAVASARERLSESEVHELLACMRASAEWNAKNGYFMKRIKKAVGSDRFEAVPLDAYEFDENQEDGHGE